MSQAEYRPYPGSDTAAPAGAREWMVVVRPLGAANTLEHLPSLSRPMTRPQADAILRSVCAGGVVDVDVTRYELPADALILEAGPDRRYAHFLSGFLRTPRMISVEICRILQG